MFGILVAGIAPALIRPGLLMPVKTLWVPPLSAFRPTNYIMQLQRIPIQWTPLWKGVAPCGKALEMSIVAASPPVDHNPT